MGSPIKYIYGQDPLAILADIDCVAVVPTSPAPRTAIYGWICIHVESIVRANGEIHFEIGHGWIGRRNEALLLQFRVNGFPRKASNQGIASAFVCARKPRIVR